MKKLLLIPTTLTALTPLISCLSGCSKIVYTVTNEEMLQALSMAGIEYMQANEIGTDIYEGQTYTSESKHHFSPSVYYSLDDGSATYSESYVVNEGDSYTKYSRTSPQQQTWTVVPDVGKINFKVPTDFGAEIVNMYVIMVEIYKSKFEFINADKSYTATASGTTNKMKLYFENKKLVKYEKTSSSEMRLDKSIINFTYKQHTPTPPKI